MNFHSQTKPYSKNRLADINDAFRQNLRREDIDLSGSRLCSVSSKLIETVRQTVVKTLTFENNDHEYGFVEVQGMSIIWAINYLNKYGTGVSQTPDDENETVRTMSIQRRLG